MCQLFIAWMPYVPGDPELRDEPEYGPDYPVVRHHVPYGCTLLWALEGGVDR